MTAVDITALIVFRTRANEKIAATSSNLKGTYKRYLREGAGVETAAATELAKRDSINDVAFLPQSADSRNGNENR